jgi:hypothetical protein
MSKHISFALAAIELALSQLLYSFNWKLPNDIKPEELHMFEFLGLSFKRKNDLYLVAVGNNFEWCINFH